MAYTRRHWVDYPDTTTPIDADALNNIEDGIEESHNIQLLAVTDTAPSECAEGDKYYDTTTGLIYTATGTDEWGETGETPIADILYIVLSEQKTYTYDGTDLISVGGSGGGANIVNEYSESTTDGYSANYINDLNTYSTTETKVGTWTDGKPIYRKVITGTLPSTNYTAFIEINNIDTPVSEKITVDMGDSFIRIPFIKFYSANYVYCDYYIKHADKKYYTHFTAGTYGGKPFTAIVEYTKTTD